MNGRMKELVSAAMVMVMVLSLFGAFVALPAGAAVQAPQLITYTITNTTITPSQTTSIDVRFSERVEAWIKIEDENRNLVNELYYSNGVTNPRAKTWDGTYTNGTVVPDGDYYVNVTGLNRTTELNVVNNTETITVTSGTEPPTVTRTYAKGTEPGTAVVTVSYTVNTAISSLTIKENIPSDWTITAQTSSPTASTYKAATHEWLYLLPPVGSGTITYTVSGPAGDTDTISGTYDIGAGGLATPSTTVTLTGASEIVITFVEPPTPANGATVTVNYVNVTVSIAQTNISTVLLNWNGENETMTKVGLNSWSYHDNESVAKTGLVNGTYTYKVYANDTLDNWGVSKTRTVTVNISEPTGATITGTIKGINQETISNAAVTIDGYSDTTDADGKYSIMNVPSGLYTISVTATGYRSESKADVSITTDATVDFVGNDGLLKEPCSDTTYALGVITKWANDVITDTTKVLTQIQIWAAS